MQPLPLFPDWADGPRISSVKTLSGVTDRGFEDIAAGGFLFPLQVKRDLCFHRQETIRQEGIDCYLLPFFERLQSADELFQACQLLRVLNTRDNFEWHQLVIEASFEIFPSMFDAVDGRVPMPQMEEETLGQHVVLIAGASDDLVYFAHSWSQDGSWGDDDGYGSFSWDYIDRFLREAWVLRLTAASPSVEIAHPKGNVELANMTAFAEYDWATAHPIPFISIEEVGGREFLFREVLGVGAQQRWVQVVVVESVPGRAPFVVAWLHARAGVGRARVEELFVWPAYRKRGVGAALLAYALVALSASGCRTVEFVEPQADIQARRNLNHARPSWLDVLGWNECVGLGVGAVTDPVDNLSLLAAHIGRNPGCGLVVRRKRVFDDLIRFIEPDIDEPAFGMVLERRPYSPTLDAGVPVAEIEGIISTRREHESRQKSQTQGFLGLGLDWKVR